MRSSPIFINEDPNATGPGALVPRHVRVASQTHDHEKRPPRHHGHENGRQRRDFLKTAYVQYGHSPQRYALKLSKLSVAVNGM